MIKLYQLEHCPYCKIVREKLEELQVSYITVPVPKAKEERKELIEVSGQHFVPTLIDGDVIIADDEQAIVAHLEKNYRK